MNAINSNNSVNMTNEERKWCPKFNLILINETIVIAEQSGFFFHDPVYIHLYIFFLILLYVRAWLQKSIKMYNERGKVEPIRQKNVYPRIYIYIYIGEYHEIEINKTEIVCLSMPTHCKSNMFKIKSVSNISTNRHTHNRLLSKPYWNAYNFLSSMLLSCSPMMIQFVIRADFAN